MPVAFDGVVLPGLRGELERILGHKVVVSSVHRASASALRRKHGALDYVFNLRLCLDTGDHDALGTQVEGTTQQMVFSVRYSHERSEPRQTSEADQVGDRLQAVGTVLHVEEEKIASGQGHDLDDSGRAHLDDHRPVGSLALVQ